jgi:hypothetical protein
VAVDIAGAAIAPALARMAPAFPGTSFAGVITDFSQRLDLDGAVDGGPATYFCPGSSIGNFSPEQTRAFLAGVRGVTTGSADALSVVIDSSGQLGTISSSRRFKEDIHDIGAASSGTQRLRPVTFRYRAPSVDGSKALQYGLIAEEVAEVNRGLVVYEPDGQALTVKYNLLPALLLNEVQRQQRTIDELTRRLEELERRLTTPQR